MGAWRSTAFGDHDWTCSKPMLCLASRINSSIPHRALYSNGVISKKNGVTVPGQNPAWFCPDTEDGVICSIRGGFSA